MPRLFLVPNAIHENNQGLLPVSVASAVKDVRTFFVEEPKSARRILKSLDSQFPLSDCRFLDLNEHSTRKEIQDYTKIIISQDAAIISEAGCPCVADPGADLVLLAHQNQVEVIPLVGPSSILLALMASGLNGQNFAFNGYIPKEKEQRSKMIKLLEDRSLKEKQTQMVMETPYRNQSLLEDILAICRPQTLLCIACHIAGHDQMIKTMSIHQWKKALPDISKKPALFLLSATS